MALLAGDDHLKNSKIPLYFVAKLSVVPFEMMGFEAVSLRIIILHQEKNSFAEKKIRLLAVKSLSA